MSDSIPYTDRDWKGFPLSECYCHHAPVVCGCRIWRCNVCVNAIIESKNDLVRENNELRSPQNSTTNI